MIELAQDAVSKNEFFLVDVNFWFGFAACLALFIVGLFTGWVRLGKRK